MSDRRDTLRILGAVGTTCAFPYSADELYGQHEHSGPSSPAPTPNPVFFSAEEFETVKALAELIIPATDTPGAIAGGVPQYIDFVVNSSANWRKLFREGIAWLNGKGGQPFQKLPEARRIAIIKPLIAGADQWKSPVRGRRSTRSAPMEVRFMKAFKSMTSDGYFTSKTGLVDTLGYKGNTVLGEFPSCEIG